MNRDTQMLLLIGLVGLGAWLWFTRSGRAAATAIASPIATGAATVVETVKSLIRGERNNNPGNLEISTAPWVGKIPVDQNTDGRFEQFREYHGVPGIVWGIRALGKTLLTYYNKHGLRTVRAIISRWAPAPENDTVAYANAVSKALGVSPDAPLALANPSILFGLVKAIIRHENGRVAYDDATIKQGVERAYA